jgi:hypothetical protein
MSNRDSTTSGMNRDDDDRAMGSHPGGWGDNDNDHMRGDGNWHHHWGSGEHRHMGGMWRHRMMLRAMGGARFHFSRGNGNIDVRCSVQEDMQACVRAAGELLDKIAAMHRGVHGDTTGSATGKDMTPSAPSTAPGGGQTPRSPADEVTPKVPGERM